MIDPSYRFQSPRFGAGFFMVGDAGLTACAIWVLSALLAHSPMAAITATRQIPTHNKPLAFASDTRAKCTLRLVTGREGHEVSGFVRLPLGVGGVRLRAIGRASGV